MLIPEWKKFLADFVSMVEKGDIDGAVKSLEWIMDFDDRNLTRLSNVIHQWRTKRAKAEVIRALLIRKIN